MLVEQDELEKTHDKTELPSSQKEKKEDIVQQTSKMAVSDVNAHVLFTTEQDLIVRKMFEWDIEHCLLDKTVFGRNEKAEDIDQQTSKLDDPAMKDHVLPITERDMIFETIFAWDIEYCLFDETAFGRKEKAEDINQQTSKFADPGMNDNVLALTEQDTTDDIVRKMYAWDIQHNELWM